MRLTVQFLSVFLSTVLFAACSSSSTMYEKNELRREGNAAFKEKVRIRHAKGFSITYQNGFKVVQIISPFEKQADTATYLLVPRGNPRPASYSGAEVIEIPVKSLVAMSSLHIGLVGFLEAEDVLTGLGNLQYVSSQRVLDRIQSGRIKEVGKDQALNEELLISMQPDLIMATGSPVSKMNRYQSLKAAGIPVMLNSEWVETTPLGRAEWVKLMGALLNKEEEVNKRFDAVEKQYNKLAQVGRRAAAKPALITGMNARDAWFVPNGNSYVCRFLKDAGASYHWEKTKATGSLPLNFEAVYPIALQADFWLNVSIVNLKSKVEVLAKDSRYADFKAFKNNKIYGYHRRTSGSGANDYWESGAVNPQEILADLIHILHPELLPDRELYYYKQIN